MTEITALIVLMTPLVLVIAAIGVALYRTTKRPRGHRPADNANEAQQLIARLYGRR